MLEREAKCHIRQRMIRLLFKVLQRAVEKGSISTGRKLWENIKEEEMDR